MVDNHGKSPKDRVVGPLPNGGFMAYKWGLTNWDDPASRILILQPRNKVTAASTASATDLERFFIRPKSPGIFCRSRNNFTYMGL